MPHNKNHHYVPRCLLKPFTQDQEGKSINLLNLKSEKLISRAPVKHQCSRDYFYGKDLDVEKLLGSLEGRYASISRLVQNGDELPLEDQKWLRLFAVVQLQRTASAVERLRQAFESIEEATFKRSPEQRKPEPAHGHLVRLAMTGAVRMHSFSTDLKFILLQNKTDRNFIISDNPSLLTNRFSSSVGSARNFGIISSGAILTLPLTPRVTALFFDIGVYTISIPMGTHYVAVESADDVTALNEMQLLSAHENVYFDEWSDGTNIRGAYDALDKTRRVLAPTVTTLIRDPNLPGESYRKGTAQEEDEASEALIHAANQGAHPRLWPSFLEDRRKPKSYSNGTAIGHVRKQEWLQSRAFG
jgi:hypothetical protein